jgi:hypothetical protein
LIPLFKELRKGFGGGVRRKAEAFEIGPHEYAYGMVI